MSSEYQRLEAEASGVEQQMRDLATTVDLRSSANLTKFGQQMDELDRKLASLRQGQALIRAANSPKLRQSEREFVKGLGRKFHSQGTRDKVIQLPGGVTVTLSVTYYHRLKCLRKAQQDGGRRGLFPLLLLLGIVGSYTPQMRQRMVQAAALLGSYEEAVEWLAGEGRQRFTPAWREPRLFIIYAVDAEGRMADDFPPVIDWTL